MVYDNEAAVRRAYHTAEGDVLDVAGFIDCFADDDVFNNIVTKESYRGERLGDVVIGMANLLPDVHRLRQVLQAIWGDSASTTSSGPSGQGDSWPICRPGRDPVALSSMPFASTHG